MSCGLRLIEIVATGGATVPRRNDHSNPLCRSLLPESTVEGVPCGAEKTFASSIALAHNRSEVVFNDIKGRQIDARRRRSRGGHHKFYDGSRRDSSGPLDIKIALCFFVGGSDSRIGAVQKDVGGSKVGRERAPAAERLH